MGKHYRHLALEERCHDCPPSPSRPVDPPDRGSSGSLAIEHLSRAEAQPWPPGRLQARLRPGTGRGGPPLEGLAPGAQCRAARPRSRIACKRGWSPEQVAGWLEPPASFATRRQLRDHLPLHLCPDPPHQRRLPGATTCPAPSTSAAGAPSGRRLPRQLHQRPRFPSPCAPMPSSAPTFGHWEADLMLFAAPGQPSWWPHERKSRIRAVWPSNPARPPILAAASALAWFPDPRPPLRKTITFDNGTEFAQHHILADELDIRTFFCDPSQPLAKGRHRKRHRTSATTPCPAAPTSTPSTIDASRTPASPPTTTPRVKCLGFQISQPKSSLNCCTSNVNPHPRYARDDSVRAAAPSLSLRATTLVALALALL